MTLEQFKRHFSSGNPTHHFNNAGQAPIPDVNRDCAALWLDRFYREAGSCSMEGWGLVEKAREKLAQFIGADTSEVAFFQTTASALSQAALGIKLEPGDEILTWDQEYPSNFYPWRIAAERSGAELIQVESDQWLTPAQKILDRVTERTKVIAVSWVQYQTGSVTDLKLLSQKLVGKRIWLVADVIQGLGVRPFHFQDCGFDIVCGGSHKWLCSNYGVGFMAIKKSRMHEMNPLEFGAMTYGNPDTRKSFEIQPKTSAARYEPGSKSMIETIALIETLRLFSEMGLQNIFTEASRLAARLRSGLKDLGYTTFCKEGPIVSFCPSDVSHLSATAQKLKDANYSYALRGPGLRLSIHAFNHESEIDQLLTLLKP